MKIRAIELTNIRRFAGRTARIEGIGDGITVLCEPNEFGKSTFFDAIHALFFERHRATRAGIKALQPHVGGAPEVAAEMPQVPAPSARQVRLVTWSIRLELLQLPAIPLLATLMARGYGVIG